MILIEHLTIVKDIHSDTNRKHDLVDVTSLVISAITPKKIDSKALKFMVITSFIGCRGFENAIARILRSIVAKTLLEALLNWVNDQRTINGKPIIAFDGNVLRGSYRHN